MLAGDNLSGQPLMIFMQIDSSVQHCGREWWCNVLIIIVAPSIKFALVVNTEKY